VPNIHQPHSATQIEFVASPSLDLINAMYFTRLVTDLDGIDGFPQETRERMPADLRDELDFLFSYPAQEPGIMGALNDSLFHYPETWGSVTHLLRHLRELPAGVGDPLGPRGIQGLVLYATRWISEAEPLDPDLAPREALARTLSQAGLDLRPVLALYDSPEELRGRMLVLIQRFYDELYRPFETERMRRLERSVAARRANHAADPRDISRDVTGRIESCIAACMEDAADGYERFVFVPSSDMGPYLSCADMDGVHGLYYPLEREYREPVDAEADDNVELARLMKALSDEQRLRIVRLLRDGELYAQEIVERTGLHQSVVSRHLAFLKAVGLLTVRRQNTMKFYSLNPAARDELARALDSLFGRAREPARR
jgi:DNA-binding transcriptional ArsR family regulator